MLVHDVVAAFCCHLENAAVFHRRGRQARQKKNNNENIYFLISKYNSLAWISIRLTSVARASELKKKLGKKKMRKIEIESQVKGKCGICVFFSKAGNSTVVNIRRWWQPRRPAIPTCCWTFFTIGRHIYIQCDCMFCDEINHNFIK